MEQPCQREKRKGTVADKGHGEEEEKGGSRIWCPN